MSKAWKFPAFATDFFLARRVGGPTAGHLSASERNFHLKSDFLRASKPAGCSLCALRVCVRSLIHIQLWQKHIFMKFVKNVHAAKNKKI